MATETQSQAYQVVIAAADKSVLVMPEVTREMLNDDRVKESLFPSMSFFLNENLSIWCHH